MSDLRRIALCAPASLQQIVPLLNDHGVVTDGLGSPLIASIVAELHERGHELHLITLSPDERDCGVHQGTRVTVHVGYYRPRARDRALDAFRAERRAVREALISARCELVHAHWSYEFSLPALDSGLPTLSTIHDWGPAVLRQQPSIYRSVRLGMQARVLRSAAMMTAVSPYLVDRAQRWSRSEVLLVPNGLQFDPLPPRSRDQRHPLTIGALNAGFTRLKNVGVLIEAFRLIRKVIPGTRLRLAGPGFAVSGDAHRWAEDRGLEEDIEFVGPISSNQVPEFMRSLDLFVHPSLEESFGMVLVEAMREATPVIGGRRSGGVPWVLDSGQAGRLTDVTNPRAVADTCLSLLNDQKQRFALGQDGYRSAKARFSLPAVVDGYEAAYRQLLISR